MKSPVRVNAVFCPMPSLQYVSRLDHLGINANVTQVINFLRCLRTQCASTPGTEYISNSIYWRAHSGTGLGDFTSSPGPAISQLTPCGERLVPAEPRQPLLCGGENTNINSMGLLKNKTRQRI